LTNSLRNCDDHRQRLRELSYSHLRTPVTGSWNTRLERRAALSYLRELEFSPLLNLHKHSAWKLLELEIAKRSSTLSEFAFEKVSTRFRHQFSTATVDFSDNFGEIVHVDRSAQVEVAIVVAEVVISATVPLH